MFFKLHWFINLNIVNIIDKGICSSGMILALGARGPEFNSRNAPFKSSQQNMFDFCIENMVSLRIWTCLNIIDNDIGCVGMILKYMVSIQIWTWLNIIDIGMILFLGARCPNLNPWNAPLLQASTKGVWVLFL